MYTTATFCFFCMDVIGNIKEFWFRLLNSNDVFVYVLFFTGTKLEICFSNECWLQRAKTTTNQFECAMMITSSLLVCNNYFEMPICTLSLNDHYSRAHSFAHTNTRNNFFFLLLLSTLLVVVVLLLLLLLILLGFLAFIVGIISYVRFFICCVYCCFLLRAHTSMLQSNRNSLKREFHPKHKHIMQIQ